MGKYDELHIDVIGAGGRGGGVGGVSAQTHKPEEGVRIVAGADIVPEALKKERVTSAA